MCILKICILRIKDIKDYWVSKSRHFKHISTEIIVTITYMTPIFHRFYTKLFFVDCKRLLKSEIPRDKKVGKLFAQIWISKKIFSTDIEFLLLHFFSL